MTPIDGISRGYRRPLLGKYTEAMSQSIEATLYGLRLFKQEHSRTADFSGAWFEMVDWAVDGDRHCNLFVLCCWLEGSTT